MNTTPVGNGPAYFHVDTDFFFSSFLSILSALLNYFLLAELFLNLLLWKISNIYKSEEKCVTNRHVGITSFNNYQSIQMSFYPYPYLNGISKFQYHIILFKNISACISKRQEISLQAYPKM